MAAGVDVMGLRITARVVCDDQGVQLAEDRNLRTRLSGVEICVESRDVAGLGQRISKLLKMLLHVSGSLPLAVSRLRVCPDMVSGVIDQFFVFFYQRDQFFGIYHFVLLLLNIKIVRIKITVQ